MSLSTSSVDDVKEYTVNLTVSLTNYPGAVSIMKTLIVTITCEVQNLTY